MELLSRRTSCTSQRASPRKEPILGLVAPVAHQGQALSSGAAY